MYIYEFLIKGFKYQFSCIITAFVAAWDGNWIVYKILLNLIASALWKTILDTAFWAVILFYKQNFDCF